jgi:hypothetical protein
MVYQYYIIEIKRDTTGELEHQATGHLTKTGNGRGSRARASTTKSCPGRLSANTKRMERF